MAYYRVTYAVGGVTYTFPYPQVSASEEPVVADDGISLIGTRYRITVRGTLVGTSESDFKDKMVEMRCKTRTPRGAVKVEWSPDNSTWYQDYSLDTGPSADWGPWPGEVSFDRFTGGRAATYTWTVETTQKDCYSNACSTINSGTTNVLAVTRRYSHLIDESGFTVRNVSGTLYVTAQEAASGRDADYWRWKVVPQVPGNFKREHQSFDRSPDGTQLRFSITDREVMWTMPEPITKGQANWSLRLRGMGYMVDMSLTGEFEATAAAGKDDLLQRIGELVLAKFPNDPGLIWETRQISESIYENRVSFAFHAYMAVAAASDNSPDWVINFGGVPPGSNGAAQFVGPYGGDGDTVNSGVKANSPRAYEACTGGSTDPLANGGTGAGSSTTPTIQLHQDDKNNGSPGDGVSAEHRDAPYIAYHEQVSFEINNRIVVFAPKKKGAAAIQQQTGIPTLTVIQAGYAVRDGGRDSPPKPPNPFYGNSATLKVCFVSPASEEPLAVQGQTRRTVHWRYVAEKTGSIENGTNGLEWHFPKDVRTDDTPASMTDLPELVVIPQ